MRKVTRTVLLLCLISIAAGPAYAVKEFWQGSPPGPKVRQLEASELLNVFLSLQKQMPTLSPAEEDWLKKEVDDELAMGKFTRRALRAMDSTEYHIRTVRGHLETIINSLSVIKGKRYSDIKQEVLLWTVAAYEMSQHELWQSIEALVRAGIVDKKVGHIDDLYFHNYVLQAQGILERVVIRYLNNSLQ